MSFKNMKHSPLVAIIDYGMGNIFSVRTACERVGLTPAIASTSQEVMKADAIILPGVGAFADAMAALQETDLIETLQQVSASSKPLVGICLGMQLLMTESFEFGHHAGLGIIPGSVDRLEKPIGPAGMLKVPHVCWNRMNRTSPEAWEGSLLQGMKDGASMYFVHSFYVKPDDRSVVLAVTTYGHLEFCSALQYRNVFACQGHPERSGKEGLTVYRNLARILGASNQSA